MKWLSFKNCILAGFIPTTSLKLSLSRILSRELIAEITRKIRFSRNYSKLNHRSGGIFKICFVITLSYFFSGEIFCKIFKRFQLKKKKKKTTQTKIFNASKVTATKSNSKHHFKSVTLHKETCYIFLNLSEKEILSCNIKF